MPSFPLVLSPSTARRPRLLQGSSLLSRSSPVPRSQPRCSLSDPPRTRPGFQQSSDGPKRSFLPEREVESGEPLTPNERVLRRVEESLRRLGAGAAEGRGGGAAGSGAGAGVGLGEVRAVEAAGAAVVAAGMAWGCWWLLWTALDLFGRQGPPVGLEASYVVQRIEAVVRTVWVAGLALASGFSAVTALGLLLLAGRVAVGRTRGEFEKGARTTESEER